MKIVFFNFFFFWKLKPLEENSISGYPLKERFTMLWKKDSSSRKSLVTPDSRTKATVYSISNNCGCKEQPLPSPSFYLSLPFFMVKAVTREMHRPSVSKHVRILLRILNSCRGWTCASNRKLNGGARRAPAGWQPARTAATRDYISTGSPSPFFSH